MGKLFIVGAIAVLLTGCNKPNSEPTYGETGLPKNCRAIIKANIEEYKKVRRYADYELIILETDDIMDSINRNCGENGYSWEYD